MECFGVLGFIAYRRVEGGEEEGVSFVKICHSGFGHQGPEGSVLVWLFPRLHMKDDKWESRKRV